MEIGIGLPSTVPGVTPGLILDWARRAEAGPFSSLGLIDRIVYHNYESLITLTAAAAVTQRIRLMTTILIAPLRNTAILAKQAATLDALSGGRLVLGLGIGGREDDFHAANATFKGRGRHFEKQLATMKKIWSGERLGEAVGAIGPRPVRPGGPEILIGGYHPKAIRRIGQFADGFISGGGGDPAHAKENYQHALDAWKEEGRSGKPRFVACIYYALGPNARELGGAALRDYYSFMGPRVDYMVSSLPVTEDSIKQHIQAFADAGTDEFIFWPTIPELDQVDRLAAVVK